METGSCNAKDAVAAEPSAEDNGQETDAHPLNEQVIGMNEIQSVIEKCDTINLVTVFGWDGEEHEVGD